MNRWLWLSVLWFAGMMYALLLHQGGNAPLPFAHFDKMVHAALFFGQFWLLAKVFLLRRRPVPWKALLLAALVLAAGSEWAQGALTASRQADWRDAAADMAGAAAALYFAARVQAARAGKRAGPARRHPRIPAKGAGGARREAGGLARKVLR